MIFVFGDFKNRRKSEKIEKNRHENQKSFQKAIDKSVSCAIMGKYEKKTLFERNTTHVYNNVEERDSRAQVVRYRRG